jgi:hypothetical protein
MVLTGMAFGLGRLVHTLQVLTRQALYDITLEGLQDHCQSGILYITLPVRRALDVLGCAWKTSAVWSKSPDNPRICHFC